MAAGIREIFINGGGGALKRLTCGLAGQCTLSRPAAFAGAKVDWLILREALSSPETSWMQAQGNNYFTEIHIEIVISGDNIDLFLMFTEQEKQDAKSLESA
ncbi:hypothetical protein AAH446_15570 [Erwinia sp. P6884]|uniref:hypothetical protein n=1 Tax=Erwinia sp. P6884 TaxID=3141450 RepID=UPI00318D165F